MPASPKYEYRRNLPHYQKSDRPLFVTFRTYKDWHLPPSARDIAQAHCRGEHGGTIDLHAGVIMPTHVHLLFTPLRDTDGWPFTLAYIETYKGTVGVGNQQNAATPWPCLAGRILRPCSSF
jgi:hypothetical protein